MNKITVSLMLLFIAAGSYAQNKSVIKGILADSLTKNPLEYATVAVVNAKDTSLISYTLSDKKGGFNLSGLPTDRPTKLIISYVGYKTIRQNLNLTKGETKDFGTILFSGNNLNEVVIKGERSPIVVKKDTIEFNTEAFKTRPNAVVEELLRKLPGVQVNNDGSILVNGKAISKLLIDGKQFFGTDPKVATKNLDADLIDKIQVYDDRENDPDHKVSATKVGKIINLKLKSKIKKSTLGKLYGGGGTRDRYEAGGILSNFRDTLQVSIIGLGNNLNKTGFSQDELYNMGGFNRSGGSQVYDGTFGGRGWGGAMEKVASGGININNDYGKKLKMNLTYFYTNTEKTYNGSSFNEQSIAETKLTSNSLYQSSDISNKHAIGGLIEWNPDTLNRFRYEPKLDLSDQRDRNTSSGKSFNTLKPLLNESRGSTSSDNNSTAFSHSFSYYRRLKKEGESLNITHSLSLNKTNSDNYSINDIKSFTDDIRSEVLDRYADNNTKSNSAELSVNYDYPIIKKLTAELNTGANYSTSTESLSTFDKNIQTGIYDSFLPNQSNLLKRNTWVQNFRPQLAYQFNDEYSLRIGVNAEWQNVINKFNSTIKDQRQNYFNLLPTLSFDGPSFSISYRESIEQPQISQMQPIVREYSQLYKSIGNPDLKPKHTYEFSGNFYKYNHEKQLNYNGYTGINFSNNTTVNKNTIDVNGATTSTTINKDGGMYGYFGGNIGKQFKKSQNWQIGLNANLNANIQRNPFFLNQDEGTQYNYSFGIGQGINFNYNSLLSINTKYDFRKSITEYKDVAYKAINTYTHTLGTEFSLRWPKRIIFDAKYNYNYNPQISQGFSKSANILNLAVTLQMLKKDRGQLKLSVYDLLDQNISVSRYAYNNAVSISEQQILKRYFLATYQYKINIYKGK
ncbi:outer membrane beta-barrel protein [Pedobacter frigoris]|uniref:TonB-dependent receptor n=1 Tax=Pedobacter frigoris TaxID=2571272 RepID=A0A4U1CLH2_9SPHI|nr:outer membrane beta-barrel protein [Pedobacter frigoris]TKC07151.1 TonB-dependent receptor [Pedobacter frigoris]